MTAASGHPLKESARLWWILHREPLGLAIAIIGLGAILAAVLVLFRPVGGPTTLTGVVTAINFQDAKRRPAFNAWVDFEGGRTIVSFPAGHGCVVGSRIRLEKTRFSFVKRYFGEHYAAAEHVCDVPPTIGRQG